MDANGTITFANEATHTMLLKLELPDNPSVFIPEDKDEILRLLREGTEPLIEREIVLKDLIYAETISLNRALHVVRIYTHNITKQKHAEQQREHLLTDLEQKNAELERFTYTVSHDLKSPLITIRGFAGLIEADVERGDSVQLNKDLDRITTAADTMQELLTDLLDLARVGRVAKPPEKIGFGTIVHESAELLAVPLSERGVRLEIAQDLPDVFVDHARIRQVMNNLIENAVKFSGNRPDPVIRIGVEYPAGTPVFFVKDNGIGLDPRYLERIFNLFEKLDMSVPGTGIGLTTVRRIIEVHGGKIWAESEGVGKGMTFRFTLSGGPRAGTMKTVDAGSGT
jgi:signal transduction histidine kinase